MKLKFNPFHYPARLLVALALTLSAIQANAANLTWSTTSGSTITDGSGTWTTGSGATGSPYWWNGTADVNWAANDSAIFGGTAGTAGTVTLGGSISATKITFSTPFAGNYTLDLAGNTLTTLNTTQTISSGANNITISDSTGTGGWNISTTGVTISAISNASGGLVTVNAKITGAGQMYVGGGGAVTLANNANDFTGLLGKQNGSALTISSIKNSGVASAAGAGNKVQVGDSGIIIYNGSGDSTDRTLEIRGGGAARLDNNGSGALIWTGPISNTSSAAKTFTLGGSNTANNELKGVLANSGSFALSVTKADAGTWVLSGNNTYTGLTTVSAGTLTLSGNNSGTGGVTLTAGTLNINSATALGATASAFNINGGTIDNTSGTAKTLANNNPITLGGNFAYGTSAGTASNNLNLGTGTVNTGASRIITLNGAGALTFGGVLANTATNQGVSVTVNNGTGTTATSALNLGGISITASGDTTFRNFTLTGNGNINVTGGISNGAGSGGGGLIKSGTGILTLTGTSTYTGATTINDGVLDAIDGTGVSASSTIQLKGGVFQSSGTFTRSVATGNGKVNWGSGYSGGFAARGGLLDLQLNNGTSSLTWGNSYTNIAGDGSSLIFGSATADNRVDFKNGLNLGNGTVATRTINVIDNPNSSADIARISGAITETTAGMGLLKDGAGTLELTGNNTYTGATTISAGTLQIGAGGTSGAISSTSGISNNGTLAINRSDALTVSTIISGTGALKNNGAGTLTLTGNNTFTGGTTVSTGTLMVNNTSGSGTGSESLLVSAGATLGGSGAIAGITTISGILAPGNSIGTLTVANDVTWNGSLLSDGTANWKFELGAANTADLLRITGGASEFIKGSGSVFCFDFLGSTETGTFTLVDWDSTAFVGGGFEGTSFAATDFTYTNLGNSNTGTFQFNGSQLQFQAIPEPSAGVLMLIAGTALFVLRRRRMQ